MKKTNQKSSLNKNEKEKTGLVSSETSSNVKTGNASEEQKRKRTDASWKK